MLFRSAMFEILEMQKLLDNNGKLTLVPPGSDLLNQLIPRVSISELMGILKGKTAIALFKGKHELKKKPYWGHHFWSRGYCVTTVGMDEEKIRRYVKYQEENELTEEKNSKEYGLF